MSVELLFFLPVPVKSLRLWTSPSLAWLEQLPARFSTASRSSATFFGRPLGFFDAALSSADGIFNAPAWTIFSMGVIILPVSFTCLIIAPRYTSSAIVSLIMLLEMVIGPFWVWIGIGERPSIMMVFGSLMVLVVIVFHIFRTQFTYSE